MSELDELMDLDPLELAKSPEQLDKIIAYHRQRRQERIEGKGKRAKKDTGEATAGLKDLLANMVKKNSAPKPAAPAAPKPGSFRRV